MSWGGGGDGAAVIERQCRTGAPTRSPVEGAGPAPILPGVPPPDAPGQPDADPILDGPALAAQYPPLSEPDAAALLRQAAGGGEAGAAAVARLVAHHLYLVAEVVAGQTDLPLPAADLFQEGALGLASGLEQFLATGAGVDRLVAHLRRAVADQIAAAVARELEARSEEARWVADGERLALAEAHLRHTKGRPPTTGELALRLGWEEERVDRLREAVSRAQAAHDLELLETLSVLDEIEPDDE